MDGCDSHGRSSSIGREQKKFIKQQSVLLDVSIAAIYIIYFFYFLSYFPMSMTSE